MKTWWHRAEQKRFLYSHSDYYMWHTCGESCCVCVGDGGDDGEVWSGGLSHSTMRSWRSRSPFSAPWSSAEHGGRTECRASTAASHQPAQQTGDTVTRLTPCHHWRRNKAVGEQDSYLSPALLLAVKGALLFALLTCLWGSILLLWVGTALALCTNKRCDNITVLAGFGL